MRKSNLKLNIAFTAGDMKEMILCLMFMESREKLIFMQIWPLIEFAGNPQASWCEKGECGAGGGLGHLLLRVLCWHRLHKYT